MNTLQRLLNLTLALSLVFTSSPVHAATLKERLDAIDRLESTFKDLRNEEDDLKKAISDFEPCLIRGERSRAEIESCISRSSRIQSAAIFSRRHITEITKSLQKPELQPVPESFGVKFTALTSNFELLEALGERLRNEATRFELSETPGGPRNCDDILRRARPYRSDEIVLDVGVAVCRAVRTPPLRSLPRTSFMTEKVSIEYGEDEGVHIGPGESDAHGDENGGCLGRGCGDSNGDTYGGGEHGGHGGESRSAFREERYNRETVRSYANGGETSERPVPLSDDQIMAIERKRFETETGEKTWNAVEASSASARTANAKLAEIPKDKLYELNPGDRPAPSRPPVVVKIPGAAKPVDSTNAALRLNDARFSLESANPRTWQATTAREIGLAAVDEGQKSLASGDLEEASQATEIAEGMADIALGFTPGVGWAKDVFEAVTGKNLVTGKDLDGFERSFAIFGTISFGLGSKVGSAIKAANRIGRLAAKLGTANHAFLGAQKAARTAIHMGARTQQEFQRFIAFSNRTFGNEIGAIGDGYEQLIKKLGLPDASKLWTSTAEKTTIENLEYHADKHAAKFAELSSTPEYVVATHSFIKNPPTGVLKKIRGTDRLFYEPSTNTFAVATHDFVPRTMFKPKPAMQYWLRQPGKDVP